MRHVVMKSALAAAFTLFAICMQAQANTSASAGVNSDPIALGQLSSLPPMPCGGAAPLINKSFSFGNLTIGKVPSTTSTNLTFINNTSGGMECSGSTLGISNSAISIVFPPTTSSLSLSGGNMVSPANAMINLPGGTLVNFATNQTGSFTFGDKGSIIAPDGSSFIIPAGATLTSLGGGQVQLPSGTVSSTLGPIAAGTVISYPTSFAQMLNIPTATVIDNAADTSAPQTVTLPNVPTNIFSPTGTLVTMPAGGVITFLPNSQIQIPNGSTYMKATGASIAQVMPDGTTLNVPQYVQTALPSNTIYTYTAPDPIDMSDVKPTDIIHFPNGTTLNTPNGDTILVPTNAEFISLGGGQIQLIDPVLVQRAASTSTIPKPITVQNTATAAFTETFMEGGATLQYPASPNSLSIQTTEIALPTGTPVRLNMAGKLSTPQSQSYGGTKIVNFTVNTPGSLTLEKGGVIIDPYGTQITLTEGETVTSLGTTTTDNQPAGCRTSGTPVGCVQLPNGNMLSYPLNHMASPQVPIFTRP